MLPVFALLKTSMFKILSGIPVVRTKIPSGIPMSSIGHFLFARKHRNFSGKLGNILEINKSVPNFAYERSPCLQFCLEFQEVMTKILPGILEFSIEGQVFIWKSRNFWKSITFFQICPGFPENHDQIHVEIQALNLDRNCGIGVSITQYCEFSFSWIYGVGCPEYQPDFYHEVSEFLHKLEFI